MNKKRSGKKVQKLSEDRSYIGGRKWQFIYTWPHFSIYRNGNICCTKINIPPTLLGQTILFSTSFHRHIFFHL